jgi:predicted RNase H-like HicB family nuclease
LSASIFPLLTCEVNQDENGTYIASCPKIPGIVEQGESEAEAWRNLQKALMFTLEAEGVIKKNT